MKTLLFLLVTAACAQALTIPDDVLTKAFAGRTAALAIEECDGGAVVSYPDDGISDKHPPCSTFKIPNTLIGLELGILTSADEPFYKWDGQTRFIEAWNHDLTLRQAFQASCVPAFQNLAREIGAQRMQLWIDTLGYGDRNISAGIDVFWLPAKGRTTILISPLEQAAWIRKLLAGQLPVSEKSVNILKDVMRLQTTERGTLFGKTGSGTNAEGVFNLGWFVGFVETSGKTYAFACVAEGENIMSKDAREIVEAVLTKQGLL